MSVSCIGIFRKQIWYIREQINSADLVISFCPLPGDLGTLDTIIYATELKSHMLRDMTPQQKAYFLAFASQGADAVSTGKQVLLVCFTGQVRSPMLKLEIEAIAKHKSHSSTTL